MPAGCNSRLERQTTSNSIETNAVCEPIPLTKLNGHQLNLTGWLAEANYHYLLFTLCVRAAILALCFCARMLRLPPPPSPNRTELFDCSIRVLIY